MGVYRYLGLCSDQGMLLVLLLMCVPCTCFSCSNPRSITDQSLLGRKKAQVTSFVFLTYFQHMLVVSMYLKLYNVRKKFFLNPHCDSGQIHLVCSLEQ